MFYKILLRMPFQLMQLLSLKDFAHLIFVILSTLYEVNLKFCEPEWQELFPGLKANFWSMTFPGKKSRIHGQNIDLSFRFAFYSANPVTCVRTLQNA